MAALLGPRLQQPCSLGRSGGGIGTRRIRSRQCSAIAVNVPSPFAGGVSGVRWGSSTLQGPRSEMEDDVVLRSEGLDGFAFAAVFDGHAGFSSVEFLRFLSLSNLSVIVEFALAYLCVSSICLPSMKFCRNRLSFCATKTILTITD